MAVCFGDERVAGLLTAFLWDVIVAGLLAVCLKMKEAGSLTAFFWVVIDAGSLAVCFGEEE